MCVCGRARVLLAKFAEGMFQVMRSDLSFSLICRLDITVMVDWAFFPPFLHW